MAASKCASSGVASAPVSGLVLALAGPRAPGAALRQRLPFPAGQALPHIGSGAPVVEKPYVGSRAWLNVRN